MRGKGPAVVYLACKERITPAYAGKSFLYRLLLCLCRDHPRVCGEKAAYLRAECGPKGSPPRMRGKEAQKAKKTLVQGITPAYAGKSWAYLHAQTLCQDHPRVCGEKKGVHFYKDDYQGSPPRMRGKESQRTVTGQRVGITPAYAGKRAASRSTSTCPRDHPRVCGEKTKKIP